MGRGWQRERERERGREREKETGEAVILRRERESEAEYDKRAGLGEQHRATWDCERETHGERDERLEVFSWQDNQRQATDSELGAQLV